MINTREIAREYRLAHWAQVMQEHSQSGLSIKAYCQQIGICGNTYFYWQRKLREAAAERMLPESKRQELAPSGWVQASEKEQSNSGSLRVEIGGYSVTAYNDTDPELLKKVCRVLGSL